MSCSRTPVNSNPQHFDLESSIKPMSHCAPYSRYIVCTCYNVISAIYGMVCASVREDNPRALASGLSPVPAHNLYKNFLIAPACLCTLCIVRNLMLNIVISILGALQ